MTTPNGPPPIPPPPPGQLPGVPHRGGNVPVSQGELVAALTALWDYVLEQTEVINQIGAATVADQDVLNQVAAALAALDAKEQSDDASLVASVSAVQSEIASLEAAAGSGTPLDFTAVNAAVTALQNDAASNATDIASVAALVPAPPAAPTS